MTASSLKKTRIRELVAQQRLEEARTLCERTLATTPGDAGAWLLAAVIHGMLNKPEQAERYAREAIRLQPDYAEAYNNLGLALRLQGRSEEALAPLDEAIRLKHDYTDAYYNLGVALATERRLDEAIEAYKHALVLHPDDPETLNDMGNILAEVGRMGEAVRCYRKATAILPTYHLAYFNLGNVLVDMGRMREAIDAYQQVVKLRPDFAEGHYNLGETHRISGDLLAAIDCYHAAIRRKPDYADAHFNLASAQLLLGRFNEGWHEYAWHWRRPTAGARPFPASPWNGADLSGQKVFLHPEQGLGDELFFLRFVPRLKQRGAGSVTYCPGKKIAPLLARVPEIDHIAAADESAAPKDMVFSVGDLPRLLGMAHVEDIPPSLALPPLPTHIESVRQRLTGFGPPPYVGVTWRAGTPDKENLLSKKSPFAGIAQALKTVSATVLILQRLPAPGEIRTFQEVLGRPVHDLTALNDDLESMLALLSLIDDYVGVSNTNMHLRAGAGKTARVLVPAPPEWRWMAEGKESPWFPGFTVYRQGYDGSWEGAFDMLATDLQQAFGR